MSQTPTYWRKVKLRLIEDAIAYAEVLERQALGEDLGRTLTDAYSRYNWDLFELGPRNIAAIAERALSRAMESSGPGTADATQTLLNRATEMARAQIHCNHPDRARREIWGLANDRYEKALEAVGPRAVAELVRRDLFPNELVRAAIDEDGQSAADAEGAGAPRP